MGNTYESGFCHLSGHDDKADEEAVRVDKIAERLGLEKIGWIYTGYAKEELLNSQEAVEITKLQLKFSSK